MEQLLHFLYDNLAQELNKVLRGKEKRFNSLNNELDVLQTVLTLSKSQKEMIRLFESSGVDKSILIYQFSKEQLEECVKHNYIIQGSTINDNKYFIGLYGLYYFYSLQEISVSESFQALDEIRFKNEALSLKIQEKIWCIFLILFCAHSEDNKLDTTKLSHNELDRYFSFLKTIEMVIHKNGLYLGKVISWGTGKDSSFRKFITNNVMLPKTGFYFDRPTNNYYLDLTKRKNAIFLLNLILDNYDGAERILANELLKNSLRELSNSILIDLSVIPGEINEYIIEELS